MSEASGVAGDGDLEQAVVDEEDIEIEVGDSDGGQEMRDGEDEERVSKKGGLY